MKVAIDLQGCQLLNNRNRGIGRYSLSFIKALINEYKKDHFVLVANANLPDIESEFDQELSDKNLQVDFIRWYYPNNNYVTNFDEASIKLLGSYLYSFTFSNISADIILVTSFFEGFEDDSITQFDGTFDLPCIATIFYDLIPYLHPELYLDNNLDYKNFYLRKINELKDLDLFLTISESAAYELKNNLNIKEDRIFNISSGCNNTIFSCLDNPQKKFFPEFGEFILYAGAADPRKNLKRLIKAYSLLDKRFRDKFKLILVGKFSSNEIDLLKNYISFIGLPFDRVILTGYISDKELVFLYKRCKLFVMPSLHEGFGLPVLEAMSCGAPVIASNTSSLPEVVGNQEALFDPEKTTEITSLMRRCLSEPAFLKSLGKSGLNQAKLFSWQKTANQAYKAMKKIVDYKKLVTDNLEISWVKYTDKVKLNLLQLLQKISFSSRDDLSFNNDSQIMLVSACIDLINKNTDNTFRKVFDNKFKLSWKLEGPCDSNYSLSILNHNLAYALSLLGHKVSINITEGNGDYPVDYTFLENHTNISELYNRSSQDDLCIVNSRNMYPPRVLDLSSRINILHAYGWEETQINHNWINQFNDSLQGITVMSEFVKKILIDNGFSKPITVCGLGVDHININNENVYSLAANKFKFLHISSCFPRKGVEILLQAYKDIFTNSDDVSLIIKTFPNPHNNIKCLLEEYRKTCDNFPDVIYIDSDLNKEEIVSLYKQCDVLVAPSFGEGFGLPIAEAMLMKVPVITTAWGGQSDFCNPDNSWLLDYEFKQSESHFGLTSSVWAKPSVDHLGKLMHKVFTSSSKEIIEKTESAFNFVKTNYTWKNVAQINVNFVRYLLSSRNPRLTKIGWLTTWNSRCGIAAYSEHLIKHFSEEIVILAPINECFVNTDDTNVRRCWSLDNKESQSFSDVYQIILRERFTSLVVQFNYGFFNFKELENLILFCHKKNIRLIMIMHSTIDPLSNLFKNLKTLSKALKNCDRILVHTPKDLNRLKNISLETNVALFPHGLVDFNPPKQEPISQEKKRLNFTVATFGYCLPNKGFPELIQAVRKLSDENIPIKLKMITALYDESFQWFYEDLISLVEQLDLSDLVEINTDYLPEEETLLTLSNSDLIVFPYQNTNESSSAAVRQGIASGTPVAVTPLHIFDDVLKVVKVFSSSSIDDIANGILDFYIKTHIGSYSTDQIESRKDWINQHSFSNLAVRLQGMIRGLENNYFSNE